MSQVSKVRELIARYERYIECEEWHIHHEESDQYLLEEHANFDEDEFKQALLSIILEALPEKKNWPVQEGMPYDHAQQGFNSGIDKAKEAIKRVFGVEG